MITKRVNSFFVVYLDVNYKKLNNYFAIDLMCLRLHHKNIAKIAPCRKIPIYDRCKD